MYKRHFYQIVESNRIEKSIRQRESNRIELFFPESECSSMTGRINQNDKNVHLLSVFFDENSPDVDCIVTAMLRFPSGNL